MESQNVSLNGGDWQLKGYNGEDWLLRNAHLAETRDLRGWQPAIVPGSVQNDLWQVGAIPNPYVGMNSLACEWVKDRTWLYKKTFRADPAWQGQRVQLVFEGIDYTSRIFLNGQLLGQSKGQFLPARFEVGELLNYEAENLISVVIDPAPFEQPQIGYTSQVYTQKSRMNYWWDFCPRIVHLGIWQNVYLRVSGPARLEDIQVVTELSTDHETAVAEVTARVDWAGTGPSGRPEGRTEVEVLLRHEGEDDDEILNQQRAPVVPGLLTGQLSLRINQPELWWPNGAGEQALYVVEVNVYVDGQLSDSGQTTFGIREVEFVSNEGAPEGTLPYNLVVNGRKLYIQGWNWVPIDVLYGVERPEKRERLLRLAQRANINLLRVWGGGLIEKEAFYHLCDRLGILVWQEFIQSSSGVDNVPSTDPAFIKRLVRVAEQAVVARRNHPALAVWCGGNELHESGTRLCDDTHPALAALREVVQRLEPGRHWVSTSPAGGYFSFAMVESDADLAQLQDVHGPWEFQGLEKQYALYNRGKSLLHSEFGVEGITNQRALDQVIAPEHQWPVTLDRPVWHHLGAWWVKTPVWEAVFGGPFKDINAAVRGTQFMQAEGLRYAVEADRRRMFYNGGSMPWQFNEPFPMAACTSAVDYFGEPKPVYYTVASAYEPISLTAQFERLAWGGETDFVAQVWVANNGEAKAGELAAQVVSLDGRVYEDINIPVACPQSQAAPLCEVRTSLEQVRGELFFLDLALWDPDGGLITSSRYLFSKAASLAPILGSLPAVDVRGRVEKQRNTWKLILENHSDDTALGVWLEADKADLCALGYAYFADNCFHLLPGEQCTVQVDWSGVPEAARAVCVSGWNFQQFKVG